MRSAESYSNEMVALWADYVNWPKRRAGENGFLINQLKRFNCGRVYDAGLGDGCDSIFLLKHGFDVVSNELDENFMHKALENARINHVRLDIESYDWRDLARHVKPNSFDAVICLGNSITQLFTHADQLSALKGFHSLLRENGVLLIDQRNYSYFLREREAILQGNFRYSHRYMYCGEKIFRPISISDEKVVMAYEVGIDSVHPLTMDIYPFKEGELKQLLQEAGFSQIEEYADYGNSPRETCDFITYVARK